MVRADPYLSVRVGRKARAASKSYYEVGCLSFYNRFFKAAISNHGIIGTHSKTVTCNLQIVCSMYWNKNPIT